MQKVCNKVNLDHVFYKMLYNVLYALFKMFSPMFISFTDLSKIFTKVEKLVHPATWAICIKKVLCKVLKMLLLKILSVPWRLPCLFILHFSEVFTTQPTLVLTETDLCRAVSITKKEEPRFSLNEDVLPKQNLMSLTTRKY